MSDAKKEKFNPKEHLRTIKGQQYLDAKWRLVWLREEFPAACIATHVVWHDPDEGLALVQATVSLPDDAGMAMGHKMVSRKDFASGYIEKAETQAIGRALAILGYGTQFAQELDDDDEGLADSPVAPATPVAGGGPPARAYRPIVPAERKMTLGEWQEIIDQQTTTEAIGRLRHDIEQRRPSPSVKQQLERALGEQSKKIKASPPADLLEVR